MPTTDHTRRAKEYDHLIRSFQEGPRPRLALTEIAAMLGVSKQTLTNRLKRGYAPEEDTLTKLKYALLIFNNLRDTTKPLNTDTLENTK